jgi:hypothetical protein
MDGFTWAAFLASIIYISFSINSNLYIILPSSILTFEAGVLRLRKIRQNHLKNMLLNIVNAVVVVII